MEKGIPLYKRMQSFPKSVDEMMAEEDARTAMWSEYGVVNGTPGSADDKNVQETFDAILQSPASADDKYELLDALFFYTVNNHESGHACDLLDDILKAQDEIVTGNHE